MHPVLPYMEESVLKTNPKTKSTHTW